MSDSPEQVQQTIEPRQQQMTRPRSVMEEGDDWVYIENLRDSQSNYTQRSTGAVFRMEPRGYLGSIIEVPVRVARDPYIRKAQKRGILQFLSVDEAEAKIETLVEMPDGGETDQHKLLAEALELGASRQSGRRYRKDLPEEGEQRPSIGQEQVWNGGQQVQRALKEGAPTDVEPFDRSGLPEPTDLQRPITDPSAVLTDRVREGDPGFPATPERP